MCSELPFIAAIFSQQFASDKMRFAMLSERLPGQSAGDWRYEQKDVAGLEDDSQPLSTNSSVSGEKQLNCPSQNLEVSKHWHAVVKELVFRAVFIIIIIN